MKQLSSQHYARIITSALFIAVIAGTWDVWWHSFLGRESFWSAPHLLLYCSVIVAIGTGFHAWRMSHDSSWRNLSIFLFLVPLSAPFDELWHRAFGVEELSSPLILWSPPHIALMIALIGSFVFLLPHLQKDEDLVARQFFMSICFAGILSLLYLLASPLEPSGAWHLLGFWGAGVITSFLVFILLAAQQRMPDFSSTLLIIALFFVLASIGSASGNIDPDAGIPDHTHPPKWLLIFSFIIPAIVIEFLRQKSVIIRGIVVGLLHGIVLYTFTSRFFEPAFQYSQNDAGIAIIACVAGGLVAGILATFISPRLS